MAKRFTDTGIWDEDWFYELSLEYKLFFFYLKDSCDHAGIWKPKTRAFMSATDVEISLEKALEYLNTGKKRVRVLPNGKWFIEDFFAFQYGSRINLNNRVHQSVLQCYQDNDISIGSVRGIKQAMREGDPLIYSPDEFESNFDPNFDPNVEDN